ncbi:hypothetical protein FH972_022682 [Carpinus fangiana]|uniref:ARID domain-containing protein n=1 Tax=Carpinus fangiana TaxID=176857 RepID=A0A5N6KSX5_9ROSI|nr:hypothetical protein FH972_022682 [Carpinus fangiana]
MNNANPLFSNHNFNQGGFDPSSSFDPSAFGMNNGTPTGLDLGQFQNPQFQQRGPSPGFQHPSSFQTNPVIPAKRARPGEESIGASPRMPQNQFNASRSQTPQQPGFPNAFPGQQFQGPAWSHLQQPGASQASPSPQMQAQQFRPPGSAPQQRGQTNSPAQFPGANQDSNNGNRPQNPGMMGQMRGMPFNPSQMALQGTPGQFPGPQPGAQGMNAQAMEIQRQYQARLAQAQQQAMQQQGNRQPSSAIDPSQRAAMAARMNGQGGQSGSNPQARSQHAQNAQQFVNSYLAWAQKQGVQPDPTPKIVGRPVHYFQLFMHSTKLGLLMGANQSNWAMLANALGYPEPQQSAAVQEIKHLMETQRLASFILNYMQAMQKRRAAMQQVQGGQSQQSPTQASQPFGQTPQPAGTPTSQQGSAPPQPPLVQGTPQQRHSSIPEANGISTPVPAAESLVKTQSPIGSIAGSQASPHVKAPSLPTPSAERPGSALAKSPAKPVPEAKPHKLRVQSPTYSPYARPPGDRYGGLEMATVFPLGDDLERISVVVKANQLGAIDIHALTMAILSGLPMEIANALDTLTMVTQPELSRIYDVHLAECEELLDALLECAEQELELLVNGTKESTSEIHIPNFQDLSKYSRLESLGKLQKKIPVGQDPHLLRRSAERISAIVLILRNLSVPEIEISRDILSSSAMVTFVAQTCKHIGTHQNLFREDTMAVDVMKDLLVFLSNIATKIELPSEEDALAILHFLVAFAPSRSPHNFASDTLEFAPYVPTEHQYLPYAVEALAKILARDDPNRTFYKSIFQADALSTSSPCSLLVGSFALAIAPIPDRASRTLPEQYDRIIAKQRAAFFSMGMLAADILASLAPSSSGPGPDSSICRALLSSEDRWAQNLMHLIANLAIELPVVHPQMPRHVPPPQHERDFSMITTRGFSMLLKLADKADGGFELVTGLMPLDDVITHGLVMQQFDSQVLRQMVALSRLDR